MEWLLLAAGFLLILGTGFFVAVEFSLIALDQPTVQRAVDDGDTAAVPLLKCLKSLSTQLSSCQLGITMTTLLTGYVMEPSVGRCCKRRWPCSGLPGSGGRICLPGARHGDCHLALHAARRAGSQEHGDRPVVPRSAAPWRGHS